MKKSIYFAFMLTFALGSCRLGVREKLNSAGDAAGQVAGELVKGAASGVQKAFDTQVSLQPTLRDSGIELGKVTIQSDSIGTDNLLVAYLIFNKNYTGSSLRHDGLLRSFREICSFFYALNSFCLKKSIPLPFIY